MEGWQELNPFPDAVPGLERLRSKFKLVVLSNGENDYLAHVVKNCIRFEFDGVISVEDVGVFKPSPQVYRYAARVLKAEPQRIDDGLGPQLRCGRCAARPAIGLPT